MTIRAVLFDLDNTLTHRDQSIVAYSQHLADHYQHQL
jgi:putative hydrolase of the HAD superfamily